MRRVSQIVTAALVLMAQWTAVYGQNLYVSDLRSISYDPAADEGSIYEFMPNGVGKTYASGFTRPLAIAFDKSGNLFVADLIRRAIFRITPDGTRSTFVSPISAYGLASDSAGNLFATATSNADLETDIWKIAPDGSKTSFASGMRNPGALAFDRTENLWAIDNFFENDNANGGAFDVRIFQYSAEGEPSLFVSDLSYGAALAFSRWGELLFAKSGTYLDRTSGSILKFAADGTQSTFASGLDPAALARNDSGQLFVADGASGNIYTFSFDGTGFLWRSIFASGLACPTAMTFGPARTATNSSLAKYEVVEIAADEELPTLAADLNDDNAVLGRIIRTNETAIGFLWEAGELKKLTGFGDVCIPEAINSRGEVVGGARKNGKSHAWLYSKGANYDLAPNSEFSWASDIDDNGEIIGTMDGRLALFGKEPVLLTVPSDRFHTLRPLIRSKTVVSGEYKAELFGSELTNPVRLGPGVATVRDINSQGQLVGAHDYRFYPAQASVWNGTNWVVLGSRLEKDSEAKGINDAGEAVGNQSGVAMLWRDQLGVDLNSVTKLPEGTRLTSAVGINKKGFIAANLWHWQNRKSRAVLLRPPSEAVRFPKIRLAEPAQKIHYTNNIRYSVESDAAASLAKVIYTTFRLYPATSYDFRANTVITAPFTVLLTNVPAGEYAIHLELHYGDGMIVHTPPFFFGVAGEARLEAYRKNWDNVFEFGLTGSPGQLFVIESSSDFRTWNVLSDSVVEGGYLTNFASDPQRFFRARMVREDLESFGSWSGPYPDPTTLSLERKRLILYFGDRENEIFIRCENGRVQIYREWLASFHRSGAYQYTPGKFSGRLHLTAQEPQWDVDIQMEYNVGDGDLGRFRGTLIDDGRKISISGPFYLL